MWQEITLSDIQTRLAGTELVAMRQKALSAGQADPLPEITAQVVREVRGYVASKGNALGDGLTVPDELLAAATDMIAYRLTTRLGLAVKDDRKAANDQAKTLMGQVARGEFRVVPPATLDAHQAGGSGISVVTGRPRITRNLSGL